MSGILFHNTQDLDQIRKFYQAKMGMSLWLDQGDCVILKHGNLLLGFCRGKKTPFGGLITFFYETQAEVDEIYQKLSEEADDAPEVNQKFGIYHFFGLDPEGRKLEFQSFLHPLQPFLTGEELLLAKTNVELFEEKAIPKGMLRQIFAHCRYPSSTSESPIYTFSIIRSAEKRNQLLELFERTNETTRTAPSIVVVSARMEANEERLKQVLIGTYHFSLAARLHGLGTATVDEMDRTGIKELLALPEEEHVIHAILVGYPAEGAWVSDESRISNKVRFVD